MIPHKPSLKVSSSSSLLKRSRPSTCDELESPSKFLKIDSQVLDREVFFRNKKFIQNIFPKTSDKTIQIIWTRCLKCLQRISLSKNEIEAIKKIMFNVFHIENDQFQARLVSVPSEFGFSSIIYSKLRMELIHGTETKLTWK